MELPKEHEMPARDKYTIFTPNAKGYRKGIHKVPKWTRVRDSVLLLERALNIAFPVDTENEPKGFLVTNIIIVYKYRYSTILEQDHLDLSFLDSFLHFRSTQHCLEHFVSSLRDVKKGPLLGILIGDV